MEVGILYTSTSIDMEKHGEGIVHTSPQTQSQKETLREEYIFRFTRIILALLVPNIPSNRHLGERVNCAINILRYGWVGNGCTSHKSISGCCKHNEHQWVEWELVTLGMERNQMSSHPINHMPKSGCTRAIQLFIMENNQMLRMGAVENGRWVKCDVAWASIWNSLNFVIFNVKFVWDPTNQCPSNGNSKTSSPKKSPKVPGF